MKILQCGKQVKQIYNKHPIGSNKEFTVLKLKEIITSEPPQMKLIN